MEPMDDPLIATLAAWRADIDSVPFAHQAETDRIVSALLSTGFPASVQSVACGEPMWSRYRSNR
jgi:hypothetical protein